jgi:hypothetical protein
MTTTLKYCLILLTFVIVTLSCGITDATDKLKAKPAALAKMNEVVVVTDDDIWKSYIGDTIDYFFGQVYPLTPSPEPTFDLRRFDISDLNNQPLRRNLRTYLVVANLGDETSDVALFVKNDLGEERYQRAMTDPTFHTSVGRDKWAVGQILIYVFAKSMDELAKAIEENYEGIAARINEHDRLQLQEATYSRGSLTEISDLIMGRTGAQVNIPNDYEIALQKPEDHGLIWATRKTRDGRMDIAIREFDYIGPESASKENVKANFNHFGKEYVSSPEPNTYMLINDVDLPILDFTINISGRYAKEYRGIWEMENDFIGGPFLSYIIVNEEKGKMLQIDGFILAPGKEKRDMMQQIDLIAKSVKW